MSEEEPKWELFDPSLLGKMVAKQKWQQCVYCLVYSMVFEKLFGRLTWL